MNSDDTLDIADFRLRKLERSFKNLIVIGDGVEVEGQLLTGYSLQTPPNMADDEAGT